MPTPEGNQYTGNWTNGSASYTPEKLRDNYSSSLAGTWTWEVKPSYIIRFYANGGNGRMTDQSCLCGASTTLPANTFKRNGYIFAGWSTSPSGDAIYKDKATVSSLSSTNGAIVTLYAKWTQ